MDLKTKTVEELKALAYDFIGAIEQHQNTLRVINQEIVSRNQPETAEEVKETE